MRACKSCSRKHSTGNLADGSSLKSYDDDIEAENSLKKEKSNKILEKETKQENSKLYVICMSRVLIFFVESFVFFPDLKLF